MSVDEIIKRLAGGDMTEGSCASLSFAYAGNKAGYDVLDFRGGESRKFFATNNNIIEIAKLPGVKSTIVEDYNDIKGALNLLKNKNIGKNEKILRTHCSFLHSRRYFGQKTMFQTCLRLRE